MLQWRGAECPQRVLQAFGQGHKALAAEYDVSVLPAAEGQAEVIEPVIEGRTGNPLIVASTA
jgi:hypothetical protein